ncbi:MAG: response regulator [Deltaproteobacteria bacterium]|jgi:two-component system chemotaxis response regulator CheY|nr:response regulator [Deltaproteobacteria bacterium]
MNIFKKLKKMELMLVDDDEWIRDSMRLFFENEGCNLVTVETAEEALKIIKKQHFDIIIADFRLPGINGIKLFEHVRNSNRGLIKILITAYMDKKVLSDSKKAGIDGLIEKPFTSETIEKVLSKFL